jgi:hypothetical protein
MSSIQLEVHAGLWRQQESGANRRDDVTRQCRTVSMRKQSKEGHVNKQVFRSEERVCLLGYITPCSPLKVNWRFGRTCHFHFQGRKVSHARKRHEELATCFMLVRRNMSRPSSGSNNKTSKKPAWEACYLLSNGLALKMEATCSSETSVYFQTTTRRYNLCFSVYSWIRRVKHYEAWISHELCRMCTHRHEWCCSHAVD